MSNMLSSDAHMLGLSPSDHNATGNTGSGFGSANVYQPAYQQQNDQYFQQLIQSLMQGQNNPASQTLPTAYGAANSIIQNPFTQQYQNDIGNISQAMGQIGAADRGWGQQVSQSAGAAMPYEQQILQTGFDPQNALYARTQQQIQDQARAANSAAGLGTSGAGVGLENQAMNNFNIDWQNNLLNRQNTASQGYNTLSGAVNNALDTGANLKSAGENIAQQGAALPYNTQNQIAGNDLSALSQLSQQGVTGANQNNQILNDILSYLGKGQGASSIANETAGQSFGNALSAGGDLGSILSHLGGLGGSAAGSGIPAGGFAGATGVPFAGAGAEGSGFLESIATLFA